MASRKRWRNSPVLKRRSQEPVVYTNARKVGMACWKLLETILMRTKTTEQQKFENLPGLSMLLSLPTVQLDVRMAPTWKTRKRRSRNYLLISARESAQCVQLITRGEIPVLSEISMYKASRKWSSF